MSRFIIEVKSEETIQLPTFLESKPYLDFSGLKVCEYYKIKEQYCDREGWRGAHWDFSCD